MRITDVSGVLENEALAYKWMLKWFLFYFCNCATFLRMKEIIFCWSQGSYYDGRSGPAQSRRRVSCLHSLPKHSNPCGIATMESPILLLDEAQRMQLNFLSQVQQSMAVCCCVLIHKSNGSDIGMVLSIQTWAIPYFDISPQLSALSSVYKRQVLRSRLLFPIRISLIFHICHFHQTLCVQFYNC